MPDWYLRLRPQYEELFARASASDPATASAIAEEVYSFFERALGAGEIVLGLNGPEWDSERRPIDKVVVHHTRRPPGIRLERLNVVHLTRVYARYYADPEPADAHLRGKPIYSGHVRNGQVFYAYHWLVRSDGSAERLLRDDEIGWHAGDWGVNCRSVGICLDGDLQNSPPPSYMLHGASRLILEEYPYVASDRVLGHREINSGTTCPGEAFLEGWKRDLIDEVDRLRADRQHLRRTP